MVIGLLQKVDLRNKSYKQFLIKNEKGAITKKIIFDIFFQLDFFGLLLQVSKHSIS